MVSEDAVRKSRLSRKIDSRYDRQGVCGDFYRRDWTPKQKRRMRQKRRKNGLALFPMHF